MMAQPRGIRNNNPGNIRWGDKWQGLAPRAERTDTAFCQFIDPSWGIRALARVLISYQDKHNLRTVTAIIARWAPPEDDNDTDAYASAVIRQTQFQPDQVLDMHSYSDIKPLLEAIIRHECGKGPLKTPNSWYPNNVIDVALQRAGIVSPAVEVAKVPVTKETVGATATAGIGIAQLADVAPAMTDAIERSDAHLSSGSWLRISIGVLTIVVAVYIAWSQVKKHQSGVVA